MCDNGSEYTDSVDPRVQVELERLNNATDNINKLEVDLDEARASFRQLLCDSTTRVEALRVKLGMCVEKAKPYYEARYTANEALRHTQVVAMRYERANSAHSAAREMVYLAEQGLGGRTLDPAWQEMLNHATQRVNDAERDRGIAGTEHRAACVQHEAATLRVQALQKELKRSIAKSSLAARRSLLSMNNIAYRHQLILLPYFEMKAQFNQLLEAQRSKVQSLESQVCNAKLTYADALRNLEQISDEIHRTRNNTHRTINQTATAPPESKPKVPDTIGSFPDYPYNQEDDEYMSLPATLSATTSPLQTSMEEVSGFRNISAGRPQKSSSQCSEWTEINLEVSSPEDDIPYQRMDSATGDKPKIIKQKPMLEGEHTIKPKSKLDNSIANWISRSSAKSEQESVTNGSRRQSLDNILGPTGERVKEILSQGIMMLNISSLTERRNSEPRSAVTEDRRSGTSKKIPSPLEKTLTYLTNEDDTSDSESLASVDMLSDDQIHSLMLDKELSDVCEQVLGTPINEVFPSVTQSSASQTTNK
ncbi:uncharacterized protein CBL_20585 [Carabus blaptoides fortunei]